MLTFITDKIFSKSYLLLYLDLSNNHLQYLAEGSQFEMPALLFLSIKNNSLHEMDAIKITAPKLLVLLPNDFRMCCFTSDVTNCKSQRPWFKTCKSVLKSRPIHITSYCVSVLILLFNGISIILQFIIHNQKIEKNITFCIIIRSVNFSDLSYSIPLCILLIADSYYGENYVLNDFHWRSGTLCFIILFMNIIYQFISPCLLLFLSISRLMVVAHPLDSSFKEAHYVGKYLLCIFGIITSVSVVITLIWIALFGIIPTNLCSPFIDPTHSVLFTKIFAWVITCLQLHVLIFIMVTYYLIVKHLKESQKSLKESRSKPHSNTAAIIQFIVMITSNALCWIPSGVLYSFENYFVPYPLELIFWQTILIVPINGIVNPFIFIVTTFRKMYT